MRLLIILSILFLTACSSNKEIKEHRWIVSVGKQIVAPGFGFK
jgi:uncharacterized protein YcfL